MLRAKRLGAFLGFACALVGVGCSGGGGGNSPTAPPRIVVIQVVDNAFSPQRVQIEPGDTVRWELEGMDPTHTSTAIRGTWDSGTTFVSQGDTFQHTFTSADDDQTYEYFCSAHQDCCEMQGSVRVGANAPDPRDDY